MPGQPDATATNLVTFDVTNTRVVEVGGIAPSTIINVANPFNVIVDFEFGGSFAAWFVAQTLDYQVTIKAEALGLGDDINMTPTPLAGMTASGKLTYSITIAVPAGALPVQAGSGMYKLIATVVFPGSVGTPPVPIAGYFEGPILQIIP